MNSKQRFTSFVSLLYAFCLVQPSPAFPQTFYECATRFFTGRFFGRAEKARPSKVSPSRAVQDFVDQEVIPALRARSEKLTQTIRARNTANEIPVYDVVGIGAGPTNAITFQAIRQYSDAKTLIFEASDDMGTFHSLGKGFRLNSDEIPGQPGNTFPGAPIQPADFNLESEKHMRAEILGNVTAVTHANSGTDLLFRQPVVSIEQAPPGSQWPAQYLVKTGSGLKVYAHQLVGATGLGKYKIRLNDSGSLQLIEDEMHQAEASNRLPSLMPVDTLIKHASTEAKSGRDFRSGLAEEVVAVVGEGDGGKIGIEALFGKNPHLGPSGQVQGPKKVLWIGTDAKTKADFQGRVPGHLKERYAEATGSAFDDPRLSPERGRVEKVEKVLESDRERFRLTLRGADGAVETRIVDRVVFATGYKNEVSSLFSGLKDSSGEPARLLEVRGRPDEWTRYPELKVESTIAKKLKDHNVWVVGEAADYQWTGTQLGVAGGYIDIMGGLAAATGRQIAETHFGSRAGGGNGFKVLQLTGSDPSRVIQSATSIPEIASSAPLEVNALKSKLELGKMMRALRLPPGRTVSIAISKTGKITVAGLDSEGADHLTKLLESDPALKNSLGQALSNAPRGLRITIPSRSDGSARLENLGMIAE